VERILLKKKEKKKEKRRKTGGGGAGQTKIHKAKTTNQLLECIFRQLWSIGIRT
jgi:hypothetical protein